MADVRGVGGVGETGWLAEVGGEAEGEVKREEVGGLRLFEGDGRGQEGGFPLRDDGDAGDEQGAAGCRGVVDKGYRQCGALAALFMAEVAQIFDHFLHRHALLGPAAAEADREARAAPVEEVFEFFGEGQAVMVRRSVGGFKPAVARQVEGVASAR